MKLRKSIQKYKNHQLNLKIPITNYMLESEHRNLETTMYNRRIDSKSILGNFLDVCCKNSIEYYLDLSRFDLKTKICHNH